MSDAHVSIGQVKRDISELVNRVAYGGERIVLTSRGKPKAALVSIEDYERLRRGQVEEQTTKWQAWMAQTDALAARIRARRGEPVDVDGLLRRGREELERRSDWVGGGH